MKYNNNKFIFVFSPFYYQYISSKTKSHIFFNPNNYELHKKNLISFFKKNSILYLDIQEDFFLSLNKSNSNPFINDRYGYLNDYGNKLVSEILFNKLGYLDKI